MGWSSTSSVPVPGAFRSLIGNRIRAIPRASARLARSAMPRWSLRWLHQRDDHIDPEHTAKPGEISLQVTIPSSSQVHLARGPSEAYGNQAVWWGGGDPDGPRQAVVCSVNRPNVDGVGNRCSYRHHSVILSGSAW